MCWLQLESALWRCPATRIGIWTEPRQGGVIAPSTPKTVRAVRGRLRASRSAPTNIPILSRSIARAVQHFRLRVRQGAYVEGELPP